MLMDERTKPPDVEMVEADNLKLVLHRLDEMDKREAAVLRMRFGLNDAPPKTLKEIGESLGLTRERGPSDRERGFGQAHSRLHGRLIVTFRTSVRPRRRRSRGGIAWSRTRTDLDFKTLQDRVPVSSGGGDFEVVAADASAVPDKQARATGCDQHDEGGRFGNRGGRGRVKATDVAAHFAGREVLGKATCEGAPALG